MIGMSQWVVGLLLLLGFVGIMVGSRVCCEGGGVEDFFCDAGEGGKGPDSDEDS